MKTYEEKTQCVFQKIEEAEAMQRKHRRTVMRVVTPLMSLCLVTVIGFGVWQTGVFQNPPMISPSGEATTHIPNPDRTIQQEEMPDTIPEHPILHPGDEGYVAPVPTLSPETTSGVCEFWWKNKLLMTGDLYWAIDENPGSVFSVLATYRPATASVTSFIYDGKTLAAWAIAADNERILPDKMVELLKLGDELKYGEALYETGTPDGIKWDRSWYEDRVAFFGDLLDKYIVDGEFLRDALEADIEDHNETSARAGYKLAYQAYLEAMLPAATAQLSAVGISCEQAPYRTDALTFSATSEQLENLPLEDLTSWHFSLNSGNLKGSTEFVTTDDTEPQVVN